MSRTSDLLFLSIILVTASCGGKTTDEETFDGGITTGAGGEYSSSGSGAVGGTGLAGSTGTDGSIGANEPLDQANDGGSPGMPVDSSRPVFDFEGGRPDFDVDGGRRPNRGDTISIEQTPDAVQDAIEAELPDASIEDIEQRDEDGSVTYEVDAEVDGFDVEIIIGEDGTVVRKEEDVDPESLPEAVMTRITETAEEIEIRRATRVTEDEQVTYEIRASSGEGERIRLSIAEDGTLLENGER